MSVTLIVEDGTAKVDANGYIDLGFALNWHTNAGNAFWANGTIGGVSITDDQRKSAIIRATFYIEKRFKRRYRGLRQTVEQALGWPRIGAFDDDSFSIFGVPAHITNACAEYALRALWYQTLAPDPMRTVPSQDFTSNPPTTQPDLVLGPVRTKIQRVGPLEKETQYDGLAQRTEQDRNTSRSVQATIVNDFNLPEYPEADLWIEQVLRNPTTGTTLTRGS